MAIIADIERLFITSAAFLAGSIRKQMGYDKTLKKLMMHNDTDDTLASEWSDDTLQVLKAGAQVVTGAKTLSGITTFQNEVDIENGKLLKIKDVGNATTANIFNDGDMLRIENVNVVQISDAGFTAHVSVGGGDTILDGPSVDISSATTGVNINATTTLTLAGDGININAGAGALSMGSGANLGVDAIAVLNLEGGTGVNINAVANDINLTSTDDILLSGNDSVSVDMNKNSRADLTINNKNSTNTSVLNNLGVLAKLTTDVSIGAAQFEALTILVEKLSAWNNVNLLDSNVTFKSRVTDGLTSFMVDFLTHDGGLRLGSSTGLASIAISNDYVSGSAGAVTINAGSSVDGLYVNIGGTQFLRITNDDLALVISNASLALAAGTATLPPIQFLSGTNLTSALAGVMEYDGKAFYASPNNSNRAVIATNHFTTNVSDFTMAASAVAQSPFAAPNDVITVEAATTYFFRMLIQMTGLGATTRTTALEFDAGTATLTSINYFARITTGAAQAITTASSAKHCITAAANVINATEANAAQTIIVEGMVRINAGGTFIPQIKWSANPTGTPVCKADSFFSMNPVGSNTVASVGNWS